MLDEALIHDAASFTVDDMATSLAAQCEAQLLEFIRLR
jgi:hypothetical protein